MRRPSGGCLRDIGNISGHWRSRCWWSTWTSSSNSVSNVPAKSRTMLLWLRGKAGTYLYTDNKISMRWDICVCVSKIQKKKRNWKREAIFVSLRFLSCGEVCVGKFWYVYWIFFWMPYSTFVNFHTLYTFHCELCDVLITVDFTDWIKVFVPDTGQSFNYELIKCQWRYFCAPYS